MQPRSGLHKISYRHSSAITVMILCKSKTRPAPPTTCYIILYYINQQSWTERSRLSLKFLVLVKRDQSEPCYIISFILNSHFGHRAFLARTHAVPNSAILSYPPAVPCRQFPALSIRFKGCLFLSVAPSYTVPI